VRRLLEKTSKAFDRLQWEITIQSQQLTTQRLRLDELVTRRQRRVAIDCNKVFASIETIRQARQGMEALEATARSNAPSTTRNTTRNGNLDDALAPFLHQFSVNDPIE